MTAQAFHQQDTAIRSFHFNFDTNRWVAFAFNLHFFKICISAFELSDMAV